MTPRVRVRYRGLLMPILALVAMVGFVVSGGGVGPGTVQGHAVSGLAHAGATPFLAGPLGTTAVGSLPVEPTDGSTRTPSTSGLDLTIRGLTGYVAATGGPAGDLRTPRWRAGGPGTSPRAPPLLPF